MVDNSNKKGSSNKTIRLDKKVFCLMMIVTPIFAAYTSVLTFMAVFQPWNSNTALEVPVLGGIVDQEEEQEEETPEEETTEEVKEEQPAETPAEEAPKEEQKISAAIIKSINYVQNKTQEQKQQIEVKKEEPKPAEKSAEQIAKETCEARTDGPARLIEVRFLSDWEKTMYSNFGMENPMVDYTERVAPSGHTSMVYVNGACVPSKDGLVVDDAKNLILEESQLAEFGIAVRSNYETWV